MRGRHRQGLHAQRPANDVPRRPRLQPLSADRRSADRPRQVAPRHTQNFDIFADRMRENGLRDLAPEFLYTSGRLPLMCYKEDIDCALRTPHMGGSSCSGFRTFPAGVPSWSAWSLPSGTTRATSPVLNIGDSAMPSCRSRGCRNGWSIRARHSHSPLMSPISPTGRSRRPESLGGSSMQRGRSWQTAASRQGSSCSAIRRWRLKQRRRCARTRRPRRS